MVDVLLVEDNWELAQLIQAFLKREGFLSYHVLNAEAGISWLKSNQAQIILLDIMLPGIDGFAFCQHVRHKSDIPIIMLSACSTKTDQLMGFELGADDYLEKPIDPDILCAKVRAVKARMNKQPMNLKIIVSGDIKLDLVSRTVYLKGKILNLNVKEYDLLSLLIQNEGKTLHKDYLFNEIWGSDSMSEIQTLTVHIKRLRIHIEDDPKHPKRIHTVWGVGYRYEEI